MSSSCPGSETRSSLKSCRPTRSQPLHDAYDETTSETESHCNFSDLSASQRAGVMMWFMTNAAEGQGGSGCQAKPAQQQRRIPETPGLGLRAFVPNACARGMMIDVCIAHGKVSNSGRSSGIVWRGM